MPIKTQNLFKLKTREDNLNFHKLFGVCCLINFIYQFSNLFRYGKMNLKDNPYTPLILIFHATLSLSSFIFHVPLKRHKGLPMIYKEFRLHSIIFGLRSVICALGFYYNHGLFYNIFVINLTMIFADIVTIMFGVESKTMRGMPFGKDISELNKKTITKMHSIQQLAATMYMTGNIDSAFAPLFAIQIAAFLMTLVRKSIISELDWHRFYAISLWINIFVYWSFEDNFTPLFIIFGIYGFYYIRILNGYNKYLVWNLIFLIYGVSKDSVTVQNLLSNKAISYYRPILTNVLIIYYLIRNLKKTWALWI